MRPGPITLKMPIHGAHQNVNGSRDLTTPLSRIICYPVGS